MSEIDWRRGCPESGDGPGAGRGPVGGGEEGSGQRGRGLRRGRTVAVGHGGGERGGLGRRREPVFLGDVAEGTGTIGARLVSADPRSRNRKERHERVNHLKISGLGSILDTVSEDTALSSMYLICILDTFLGNLYKWYLYQNIQDTEDTAPHESVFQIHFKNIFPNP